MTKKKFYYDTEFLEKKEDPRKGSISLISIGIVSDDGREYYAVNSEMPEEEIAGHDWLCKNVVPHLPLINKNRVEEQIAEKARTDRKFSSFQGHQLLFGLDLDDVQVKPHRQIANEVREFLLADGEPELWSWYSAYDHVVLMWLWGIMVNKPKGLPMLTKDLQQEAERLGLEDQLPAHLGDAHNALSDAYHHQEIYKFLRENGL